MRVVSLRIHPVKSTAIRQVASAYVGFAGLRGDREWMVVDRHRAMVSARELPELFAIRAAAATGGQVPQLTLESGGSSITLAADGAESQATIFTRPPMRVRTTSTSASSWLQEVTGRAGLDVVWCAAARERRLNPDFSLPGDHAAFQDGYPVTIASLASLRQLNSWIEQEGGRPVDIDRFRPNIVLEGGPAFAEDSWSAVQIGRVRFRAVKPVDRCSMTLIDPASLVRGAEPIRTLSRHRKWDGKTWFCHHLIPDTEGEIGVGDHVVVQHGQAGSPTTVTSMLPRVALE